METKHEEEEEVTKEKIRIGNHSSKMATMATMFMTTTLRVQMLVTIATIDVFSKEAISHL